MRLVLTVVLCVIASAAQAQVLRSIPINAGPNETCAGCYGFDVAVARSEVTRTYLANGGNAGTGDGAMQVTFQGGASQYPGAVLGVFDLGHDFVFGESIFIRMRLKWASGQPTGAHEAGGTRIKFFSLGSDSCTASSGCGNSDQNGPEFSRTMLFLGAAGASECMLDQGTSYYGGGYQEHHKPSDYGLSMSRNTWTGRYFSVAPVRNIDGPPACATPPVLLSGDGQTRGTTGYAASPSEFSTYPGALASDGWYHIQYEWRCGSAGNAYVKLWGNHNTYAEPQGLQNPLRSSGDGTTPVRLDCYDWRKSFGHLSFVDTKPASNLTIVIDDVEVGRSFDRAWYPGGSQITPSRMRLHGNQLWVVVPAAADRLDGSPA